MRLAVCALLLVGCSSASQPSHAHDLGFIDLARSPNSDGGLPDAAAPDALTVVDGFPVGATLVDGGVRLRVWAPNATAVSALVGDLGAHPLALVGDGTYAGFVAGATDGQPYQYSLTSSGQTLLRTDPRAPMTGADPGGHEPTGYLHNQNHYAWQSSHFVPPSARNAVVYELHVATFVDPSNMGQGTFASAATKLADLASLGINMVELMPVTAFPGTYSWGYDPVYAFAPEYQYGSPDDLKSFIDQAHALGIGVVLDVVFNHFAVDSRKTPSMSMWCFDGPCTNGGIYFSAEPVTEWGPRPSFGVGPVHDLIVDAVDDWITHYHVDGFRWDSVIAIRNQSLDDSGTQIPEGARLLKDANVALHALNPHALSIAEDLQNDSYITQPVNTAALTTYDSGYGFDTQWDDGFYDTVVPLLTTGSDADRDVTTLVGTLTSGTPMQRVVYTEDHDKVAPQNGANFQRIPALIGSDQNEYYAKKRSSLGIALVMTAPATPMLFMGQEFLETLPFPFSVGQAINWTNETTYAGFRTLVHDLIALRKNAASQTAGLTGDQIQILHATNSLNGATAPNIAYHRWAQGGAGDDVVVVANFSNSVLAVPTGFPQPGAWHVRFNSDDKTYSSDFGGTSSADVTANGAALDGQAQSGTVNIGAYSVVILSQ